MDGEHREQVGQRDAGLLSMVPGRNDAPVSVERARSSCEQQGAWWRDGGVVIGHAAVQPGWELAASIRGHATSMLQTAAGIGEASPNAG